MYTRGYTDALSQLGLDANKTAAGGGARLAKGLGGLLRGARTRAQGALARFRKFRAPTAGASSVGSPPPLRRSKGPDLPTTVPGAGPSMTDVNKNLQQVRGPAPARSGPKPASNIDAFEAKMRGEKPPVPPQTYPTDLRKPPASTPGPVPAAAEPSKLKEVATAAERYKPLTQAEAAAAPVQSRASVVDDAAAAANTTPTADPNVTVTEGTVPRGTAPNPEAKGDPNKPWGGLFGDEKEKGLLARGAQFALPAAAAAGTTYGAMKMLSPDAPPPPYPQQQYSGYSQYPSDVPMY